MLAPATDFGDLVQSIQTLNTEDTFHARLDPQQWRTFAGYLTRHELRTSDLLIRQGDTERVVYLVAQGTFQVYVPSAPGRASKVALLRPGSIVGEPALFAAGARMAHVEAMSSAVVWALRHQRFEELAQRSPAIALEVLRAAGAVMASRIRANMARQTPAA